MPLDFIVKGSNFFLETLDQNSNPQKLIFGINPIAKVYSLTDLDKFIASNQTLIHKFPDSGFAGYIGFDGNLEFTFYENLNVTAQLSIDFPPITNLDYDFEIIKPDTTKYIHAVKKTQEYIREGDIYQVNIAHKFFVKYKNLIINQDTALTLYHRLSLSNPAPYAGFMETDKYFLLSSSPESFIKLHRLNNNEIEIISSPIKGTAHLDEKKLLDESEKEKAEHIMIVDLIRNDLGKISNTKSVVPKKLLEIQKFKNLYHLVSEISGTVNLQSFANIFSALIPGGSISGTPKIRALEIIQELEDSPRGPYTGIMGYYKFAEGGEFNILIRTIVIDKITGEISFHTGSGITSGSDPQKELEETYLKAEKLIEVFK